MPIRRNTWGGGGLSRGSYFQAGGMGDETPYDGGGGKKKERTTRYVGGDQEPWDLRFRQGGDGQGGRGGVGSMEDKPKDKRGGFRIIGPRLKPKAANYSTVTRSSVYDLPAPELESAPTYTAPVYNKRTARAYTQRNLGPMAAELQRNTQIALSSTSKNPAARRETLRKALAGLGTGMGAAYKASAAAGKQEYNIEYQNQVNAARYQHEIAMREWQAKADRAWNEYLQSKREVTSRGSYYRDPKEMEQESRRYEAELRRKDIERRRRGYA